MKGPDSAAPRRIALICVLTCALGALAPARGLAEPFESDPAAIARDADYAAGKQAMEKKNWLSASICWA